MAQGLFSPLINIDDLMQQRQKRSNALRNSLSDQAAQGARDPMKARAASMVGAALGQALAGKMAGGRDAEREKAEAANAAQRKARGQYVDAAGNPTSAGMREQAKQLRTTYPQAAVKLLAMADVKYGQEQLALDKEEASLIAANKSINDAEKEALDIANAEEKQIYTRKIAEAALAAKEAKLDYDRKVALAAVASAEEREAYRRTVEEAKAVAETTANELKRQREDAALAAKVVQAKRKEQVARDIEAAKRKETLRIEGVSKADALEIVAAEAKAKRVTIITGKQFNALYPDAQVPDNSMWKSTPDGNMAPLTKVNKANITNNLQAGYNYIYDDQGNVTKMVPIEGSAAYVKAEKVKRELEEQEGREGGKEVQQHAGMKLITSVASDVRDLVKLDSKTNPTVGFGAETVATYIAGSDAADIAANLKTLVGFTSFEKLNAIRAGSKNGAGLGSISDSEMALLGAAFGSLEQSQSKEQFSKNLLAWEAMVHVTIYGNAEPLPARLQGALTGTPVGATVEQMRKAQAAQASQAQETPQTQPQDLGTSLGTTSKPDGVFTQGGKSYKIVKGVVYAN